MPNLLARALALAASLAVPAAVAAAAATDPVPLPKAVWGGALSGLPWASGANGSIPEFEDWRGLRLDIKTKFLGMGSWAQMVASANAVYVRGLEGSQLVLALGMLPRTNRGQHERCAEGQFDGAIRAVGAGLVRSGAGNAILRLGWEANRVGGFPWAVTGDGTSYKACFRRWVSVLRAVPGQSFTVDWNMASKGTFPRHIDRMYPGDDVVDVVGVQQYDRCPPVRNEAEWAAKFDLLNRRAENSPYGLNTWLAYARSKGKRLSVPEWGVGGPRSVCPKPGVDSAFFVAKMHAFFTANADSIAYEGYFNGSGSKSDAGGTCKIAPTFYNPNASAMYKALWVVPPPPPPPPPLPPDAA